MKQPPVLLLDASALAKRYVPEPGSATVDALFAAVPPARRVTTILSYAETYSILVRCRNRGTLDAAGFANATRSLRAETLDDPDAGVLDVSYADMLAGVALVGRYNLNSADAAILSAFLAYCTATAGFVLIASDRRLLRAATGEGLNTLDPESISPADIPTYLASL